MRVLGRESAVLMLVLSLPSLVSAAKPSALHYVLPNAEPVLSVPFAHVSNPRLLQVHSHQFCANGALQSLDQLLQSSCAFPLIVPFSVGGRTASLNMQLEVT